MRTIRKSMTAAALLALALPMASAAQAADGNAVAAALASPDRPSEDMARDAARKPAELIMFAGIKPGDTVAELMPGGGYFTRIFSVLVGAKGKVFAIIPAAFTAIKPDRADALKALAAGAKAGNVVAVTNSSAADFGAANVDVAWTTENYHDLYALLGPDGMEAYVKTVFAALKPGGVFLIDDHVGLPGSSAAAPSTLHRIDPATVKAQLLAAGFVEGGESDALRNPADDHTLKVFDPAIRGKTDQFVFRFRKPAE